MSKIADMLFANKPEVTRPKAVPAVSKAVDANQMTTSEKLAQLFNKNKKTSNSGSVSKERHVKSVNNSVAKSQKSNNSSSASENKPRKPTQNNHSGNQMVQRRKVANPMSKKEEKIVQNLKEFESLSVLLDTISSQNKDFKEVFPVKSTEKFKESLEEFVPGKYKAKSTEEAKNLERIDKINRNEEFKQIKMLGKKRNNFNKGGNVKRGDILGGNEGDIWCAKCKIRHDPSLHPKPKFQDIDMIFNNKTDNSKTVNNRPKNSHSNIRDVVPKQTMSKIDSIKQMINRSSNNKVSNLSESKITQKVPSKEPLAKSGNAFNNNNTNVAKSDNQKQKSMMTKNQPDRPFNNQQKKKLDLGKIQAMISKSKNGAGNKGENRRTESQAGGVFRREDFYEDDGFIVSDDEEDGGYRRHVDMIKNKFRRGNNYYQDDYSDDNMEATFDVMQGEEQETARIGAEEDFIEELREQEMLKKKNSKKR